MDGTKKQGYTRIKYTDHTDWLELRGKGIGGSDAGAIAGVNPWRSPMAVYLDKIGETDPIEENDAMYWGTVLEDVVAKEFVKQTGLKVRRDNHLLQSKAYPYMVASVDRVITDPKKGTGILECKTTNAYNTKEWEDGNVPDSYYLQLQHYLAVTGYAYGYMAVLIGGNKYKHYYIERDAEVIASLIELEADFWHGNVLAECPPEMDGSESTDKLLSSMYKGGDKEPITIEAPEVAEAYEQLISLKSDKKELDTKIKLNEQKIKAEMQDHETALINGHKVKWSTVVSNRLDAKSLKAEAPEVYAQYARESVSRRFAI